MTTTVKIPTNWTNQNPDVDVLGIFMAEGYTIFSMVRNAQQFEVIINENLSTGQQLLLTNALESELNKITYEIL